MPRGIGREIARRVLDRTDGRPVKVVVRIGQPVEMREDEWACPYSISGIGLHGFRRSLGVDALQSLMLAIEAVRVTLAPHRSALTWLDGEPGGIGITVSVPYAFGQQLAERLEALVERETLRREDLDANLKRRARARPEATSPRQGRPWR